MADELVKMRTDPLAPVNVPRPMSSFVGRDAEIAEVSGLIHGGARLVTLTGPGGSGKTRLAIEVAAALEPDFDGDVRWISLAVVRSPQLFTRTVANALGAPDSLAAHIGSQRLLLLLDNFEQIIAAAPQVVTLLEGCPELHVLVTSRQVLRVTGETEFAVPPLASADAVELFCHRAGLAPNSTIGELCDRLDNLPLALELAAARTRVLSPSQIMSRLSGSLDLFQGGRGAEPRQQTLRAAIEWSCQLLDARELRLFTRLGVFDGGCTVEAAEAVTDADIDGLQSLVEKNLLRHIGERFWMLETIREYAVELLAGSAEAGDIHSRHAGWCIQFLEDSERRLTHGHPEAAREMEQEYGNVRAAFTWCIATNRIDDALSLVRLRLFWQSVQAHVLEAQEWMETVLAHADDVQPSLRVRALTTAGDVRRVADDLDGARAVLEHALALERELSDDEALAVTAYSLGRVEMSAGNYVRAQELTRIGLASARATGDRESASELSAQLAELTYRLGDTRAAESLVDELIRARDAPGSHSEGDALRVLAMVARDAGEQDRSRDLLDRCLAIMRRLSDTYCVSSALGVLGDIELRAGRSSEARAAFREALDLQRTLGQWHRAVDSLWGVAASDVATGRLQRGAEMLASEEKLREDLSAPVQVTSPEHHAAVRLDLERQLDSSLLTTLWHRGRSLRRDEAIAMALADDVPPPLPEQSRAPAPTGTAVLRREGEYWTVDFGGDAFRLKDSKGLHHLAVLLRAPGREFHVLDLVHSEYGDAAAPALADAGPVLDEHAKAAYRARLHELEDDLAEATSWSDSGRVTKIREEMEFLTAELTSALGLGGRDRRAVSQAERARVNVTRAIRSAVQRIHAHNSHLGDHLDATLHTGTFCVYRPDPRHPITWTS